MLDENCEHFGSFSYSLSTREPLKADKQLREMF